MNEFKSLEEKISREDVLVLGEKKQERKLEEEKL